MLSNFEKTAVSSQIYFDKEKDERKWNLGAIIQQQGNGKSKYMNNRYFKPIQGKISTLTLLHGGS